MRRVSIENVEKLLMELGESRVSLDNRIMITKNGEDYAVLVSPEDLNTLEKIDAEDKQFIEAAESAVNSPRGRAALEAFAEHYDSKKEYPDAIG